MSESPDELDKLLSDVRKTISDNKLFLEKLVDDEIEVGTEEESEDRAEAITVDEDFEEL